MAFVEKLKKLWEGDIERCNDCEFAEKCLCYNCHNIECKVGTICKKEKPITYCQCQHCNHKDCRWCKPDIH